MKFYAQTSYDAVHLRVSKIRRRCSTLARSLTKVNAYGSLIKMSPVLTITLPTTLTSIVFFLPIASDRFPRPSAPKNKPHMNIHVEIDEIGIFASSQTQ